MSAYPSLGPKGLFLGRPNPQGWDRVILGAYYLPGKARPRGARIALRADHKVAIGRSGQRPTLHGMDGQRFQLEWAVWDDDDILTAANLLVDFLPPIGGDISRQPYLMFRSPWTAHLHVTTVVCLGGSQWEPDGEFGVTGRKCALDLLHVISPSSVVATHTPKIQQAAGQAARRAEKNNPNPTQQPGTSGK